MSTFSNLQAAHEELVNKAQSSEEILEQVQQYLKDIQSGSSRVSSAQERDQLRANLRYWAGYVYEKTGKYPNVDLLPSTVLPQKNRRVLFSLVGGLLLFLSLFVLGYLSFDLGRGVDMSVVTAYAQTLTATMWTPGPVKSATHIPKQAIIVKALNDELRQAADPLGEALDAKFYVMDIGFDQGGNPPLTTTMSIQVKCESVATSSCTAARAFVVLAHVFEKDGVRKKTTDQIPTTIAVLQVRAFDHMNPIGIIEVSWRDLLAFTNGSITGDQLAARIARFSLSPTPALTPTPTP